MGFGGFLVLFVRCFSWLGFGLVRLVASLHLGGLLSLGFREFEVGVFMVCFLTFGLCLCCTGWTISVVVRFVVFWRLRVFGFDVLV